jgi:hypothetical protein
VAQFCQPLVRNWALRFLVLYRSGLAMELLQSAEQAERELRAWERTAICLKSGNQRFNDLALGLGPGMAR